MQLVHVHIFVRDFEFFFNKAGKMRGSTARIIRTIIVPVRARIKKNEFSCLSLYLEKGHFEIPYPNYPKSRENRVLKERPYV